MNFAFPWSAVVNQIHFNRFWLLRFLKLKSKPLGESGMKKVRFCTFFFNIVIYCCPQSPALNMSSSMSTNTTKLCKPTKIMCFPRVCSNLYFPLCLFCGVFSIVIITLWTLCRFSHPEDHFDKKKMVVAIWCIWNFATLIVSTNVVLYFILRPIAWNTHIPNSIPFLWTLDR